MTREQGKQWAEAMAERKAPKPYPYPELLQMFVERCKGMEAGERPTLGMTNGTNALEQLKRYLGDGFHVEDVPEQDRIAVTRKAGLPETARNGKIHQP